MTSLTRPFANRTAAGLELAKAVLKTPLRPPVLILGLPRGGVPVAFEVARALEAPLDVLVVRKIGLPGQPELAVGAIAAGGITVRQPLGGGGAGALDSRVFAGLAERERLESQRLERLYRGHRSQLRLTGKTVVLVDDGLATGATMVAAIRAARQAHAAGVVVAAPVASDQAAALVGSEADGVVILRIPVPLYAVGESYADFGQVDDSEVCRLVDEARQLQRAPQARQALD